VSTALLGINGEMRSLYEAREGSLCPLSGSSYLNIQVLWITCGYKYLNQEKPIALFSGNINNPLHLRILSYFSGFSPETKI
jgi:hypothetical protein